MRNMVIEAKERVYLIPFSLEGATIYFVEKSQQQIRFIVDSTNVLTGDIDDGEYSTCLYSKKKNLIDLLKDSLKNEIKIIEIKMKFMKGKGIN
jgi:hypothetical protein